MRIFHLFVLFLLIFKGVEGQIPNQTFDNDSCGLWKNYQPTNNINKFDTLVVKVLLIDMGENVFHHPYLKCDKSNQFYRALEKKYSGLKLMLSFKPINCDMVYAYPFVYKSKYEYTLFKRKNLDGKLVNWIWGKQMLKIKIARYNRYFEDGSEFISIIHDIEPINEEK